MSDQTYLGGDRQDNGVLLWLKGEAPSLPSARKPEGIDDMNKAKESKLVAAGWAVGTPVDFLHLSVDEEIFIDLKLALAATLRQRRLDQHLSQIAVAKRLQSSQSRVAKMELADKTVTVDLLIRSILRLGGTREMVAAALCREGPCPPPSRSSPFPSGRGCCASE
jgi:hypothetical protein